MNSVFALIEKRGESYCAPGYVSLVRAVMCKELTLWRHLLAALWTDLLDTIPANPRLISAHLHHSVRCLASRRLPELH